jgi:YD repeat-containing protein
MNQNPASKPSPRTLRYRADQLVLIEQDPHGFGSDAIVCFDFDGNGDFKQEVRTDAQGRYSFALDTQRLAPDGLFSMFTRAADGKEKSGVVTLQAIREELFNPAGEVPLNRVSIQSLPGENKPPETGICTSSCRACLSEDTLAGDSLNAFAQSATPTAYGVELATGRLRQSWPITSFHTRGLGFGFTLHHSSLVDYDGPWGQGFSHAFNMMIVQDGPLTGQMITTDLRCFPIYSDDGRDWWLPQGFFSNLRLDTDRCRWTMTHFSGLEVEFFQGALRKPGYPLSICDPNGNTTYLEYDNSGLLQCIVTDLGQVQRFAYDDSYRLRSFTDHLGRVWQFGYDGHHRLTRIRTPATEYADIAACQEITDRDLPRVLVKQPRTTLLGYADERFPSHITAITDPRGAIPEARVYDGLGRVQTTFINSRPVQYQYDVDFALDKLEPANLITRVTDREG